jgi:hypothetical protein
MQLKPGARLRSVTDSTMVVVVRTPGDDVDVRCGGHPMVPASDTAAPGAPVEPGFDGGTQLGKRYSDEDLGLELLCSTAGPGSLSVGDQVLDIKGAKPLPSSD